MTDIFLLFQRAGFMPGLDNQWASVIWIDFTLEKLQKTITYIPFRYSYIYEIVGKPRHPRLEERHWPPESTPRLHVPQGIGAAVHCPTASFLAVTQDLFCFQLMSVVCQLLPQAA